MRWDQIHWAAIVAGGVAAGGLIAAVTADGHITAGEWWSLIVAFGGTFFAYLKDHAPAGDYVTPPGSKG